MLVKLLSMVRERASMIMSQYCTGGMQLNQLSRVWCRLQVEAVVVIVVLDRASLDVAACSEEIRGSAEHGHGKGPSSVYRIEVVKCIWQGRSQ